MCTNCLQFPWQYPTREFKWHLNTHTYSKQSFTLPPSEPLNVPWFVFYTGYLLNYLLHLTYIMLLCAVIFCTAVLTTFQLNIQVIITAQKISIGRCTRNKLIFNWEVTKLTSIYTARDKQTSAVLATVLLSLLIASQLEWVSVAVLQPVIYDLIFLWL